MKKLLRQFLTDGLTGLLKILSLQLTVIIQSLLHLTGAVSLLIGTVLIVQVQTQVLHVQLQQEATLISVVYLHLLILLFTMLLLKKFPLMQDTALQIQSLAVRHFILLRNSLTDSGRFAVMILVFQDLIQTEALLESSTRKL